MKILVTGGTGFIGSCVVRQLAEHPDVETIVLTRGRHEPWRLRDGGAFSGPRKPRVDQADFTDPSQCERVLGEIQPEVVIHLAMAYHTLGSTGGADITEVNYHGTLGLLQAFQRVGGSRFVAAGTCFEYGHQEAPLISEAAPCQPVYDYAQAKARATAAILDRAGSDVQEAIVLRVFAPYGPREDSQRIVPLLIRAALRRERLQLSPGEQVRDYVYVEDVAAAFVTAALHPRLPAARAVYNVCTGVGHSLRQLAEAVGAALGRPLDLAWGAVPYRPNEMMRLVGDNGRIRDELGWQPQVDLSQGLRYCAGWWDRAWTNPAHAA
jgi:nucleoside-diphosphate-sugar epimerase